jgi:hypothetical protein
MHACDAGGRLKPRYDLYQLSDFNIQHNSPSPQSRRWHKSSHAFGRSLPPAHVVLIWLVKVISTFILFIHRLDT